MLSKKKKKECKGKREEGTEGTLQAVSWESACDAHECENGGGVILGGE
jgi:hypothetical protein